MIITDIERLITEREIEGGGVFYSFSDGLQTRSLDLAWLCVYVGVNAVQICSASKNAGCR